MAGRLSGRAWLLPFLANTSHDSPLSLFLQVVLFAAGQVRQWELGSLFLHIRHHLPPTGNHLGLLPCLLPAYHLYHTYFPSTYHPFSTFLSFLPPWKKGHGSLFCAWGSRKEQFFLGRGNFEASSPSQWRTLLSTSLMTVALRQCHCMEAGREEDGGRAGRLGRPGPRHPDFLSSLPTMLLCMTILSLYKKGLPIAFSK